MVLHTHCQINKVQPEPSQISEWPWGPLLSPEILNVAILKSRAKISTVLSRTSWQIVFHLLFHTQKCHRPWWVRQEVNFHGGQTHTHTHTHTHTKQQKTTAMNSHSTSRSPVCRARCQVRPTWIVPTIVPVRTLNFVLCQPTFPRNKLRLRDTWWHFYDTASRGLNHSCAEKGARAHWISRSSRSIWAPVKAGCTDLKVMRWEIFPHRKAAATKTTTFFSVPPWRAHILKDSRNLSMHSAAPWVGPGQASRQWHHRESSGVLRSGAHPKLPAPQGHVQEKGQEYLYCIRFNQ